LVDELVDPVPYFLLEHRIGRHRGAESRLGAGFDPFGLGVVPQRGTCVCQQQPPAFQVRGKDRCDVLRAFGVEGLVEDRFRAAVRGGLEPHRPAAGQR
jgi:hypothetical protein